jgi:hypothetical protein
MGPWRTPRELQFRELVDEIQGRAVRFSRPRTTHDHLPGDRRTMIVEGSNVNRKDIGLRDRV